MKNRAKCKLCESIIESFHQFDYVTCKCGEIIVDGGDALRCYANNWENFLRIDDEGNEIIPRIECKKEVSEGKEESLPSKEELLKELERMIANIESLPPHAMSGFVTHYDLASSLILLLAILRSDCRSDI